MIKVPISKIYKTLQKILIKRGFTDKEAKIIAHEYIEGELQGKLSHGLMAFPGLVERFSQPRKKIKVVKQTAAFLYLDGQNNPGILVGHQASKWAIKTAKKQGIAAVAIRNMLTWLRPGSIAKLISDQGFIALVLNDGGKPMVAPPGGFEPVIGTNPIGIGIPSGGQPILVDMATAKRAWGEVRKAEAEGRTLPAETFYDKNGRYAIKPQEAYSVLPAGDYKGFALGLMIEILTGSLVAMPMGVHKPVGDYRTLPRGALILVISPQATTTLAKFNKANTQLIREIKQVKKLKGIKEILIPGERAMKQRQINLKRGYLEVSEDLWGKIISS